MMARLRSPMPRGRGSAVAHVDSLDGGDGMGSRAYAAAALAKPDSVGGFVADKYVFQAAEHCGIHMGVSVLLRVEVGLGVNAHMAFDSRQWFDV